MEVEIKIPLEPNELSELEKKLDHLGVRLAEPEIQRDVYFKKGVDEGNKGPARRMFRVRYSPAGSQITMKLETDQEGIWDEVETAIDSGEIAEKIIRSAGAKHVITVEKSRRRGSFRGIDVLIDDVRGLGLYLEVAIETQGRTQEAQAELFSFLETLGFAKQKFELRGYPRLVFERNSS